MRSHTQAYTQTTSAAGGPDARGVLLIRTFSSCDRLVLVLLTQFPGNHCRAPELMPDHYVRLGESFPNPAAHLFGQSRAPWKSRSAIGTPWFAPRCPTRHRWQPCRETGADAAGNDREPRGLLPFGGNLGHDLDRCQSQGK